MNSVPKIEMSSQRRQVVGLCRVSGYAGRVLGSPVVAGVGAEILGIIR
jgi:hypothetical protein